MKRVTLIPVLLAACFSALPAGAEVLLEGRSSRLLVLHGPNGPWTPRSAATSRHLNPGGDERGDGSPGYWSSGRESVVAWHRPTDSRLQVALSERAGWRYLPDVSVNEPFGTPRVVRADHRWLVLWQENALSPQVLMVGVSDDGVVSQPVPLIDGLLSAAVARDDALHAVTFTPAGTGGGLSGSLHVTTVLFTVLPADPLPILRIRVDQLGAVSPTGNGGSGHPRLGLPSPRSLSQPDPTLHVRVHEGTKHDGAPFFMASWWPTPWELRAAELDDGGLVLPIVELQSRKPHSPDLVKKALAVISDR